MIDLGIFNKSKTRVAAIFLVLVAVCYFVVINQKMLVSLPYPMHVDESHRLEAAFHILETRNFNPHYFHKPSFPIYLTAVGMAVGFINESSKGKINNISEIGSLSYPYYSHPEIVSRAKQIFCLAGALAMIFAGLAGYKAFRFRLLLIVPVLLMPFSAVYVTQSYRYINVNILGAFFVAVLLYYLAASMREMGVAAKAVVPGILCGLVISSKYNLLVIYLPCLLAIFFYEREKLFIRSIVLGLVSVCTVIVLNPYFILDLPAFLHDTAFQVNHYMVKGHRGFEGTPGMPQFLYYMRTIIDQFGLAAFFFSLLGIIYSFRLSWKTASVFLSFPVGMLLLMSASKVNFIRNLLAVYLLWPLFVGLGMVYGYKLMTRFLRRIDYFGKNQLQTKCLAMILLGSTLAVTLPYDSFAMNMSINGDSRTEVADWLKNHAHPGATIVVPEQLQMDTRSLEGQYKIINLRQEDINLWCIKKNFFKKNNYILLPTYGFDKRWPQAGRHWYATQQLQSCSSLLLGAEEMELVGIFGANDILLNYFKSLRDGNPKIILLRSTL